MWVNRDAHCVSSSPSTYMRAPVSQTAASHAGSSGSRSSRVDLRAAVTTTLAAAQLCRALFLAIHGGEVAARTALRKQLRQYDVLRSFPKSEWSALVPPLGRHDFLGPMGAEMAAMCDDADERKRLNQAVARAVPALVSAVRAVSSDHAVQAIALSNYVEALAHFVVGREKIQPFLDVCIWGDGPWEP